MEGSKLNLNKEFVITEENVSRYANAMGEWIREKVNSAKSQGVVLGMSGGIDCSVVACLCYQANVDVHLVMMPYGSDMEKTQSYQHAMELIEKFNLNYSVYNIQDAVDAVAISDTILLGEANEATKALSFANIRPRVRMTYLYQLAQLNSRLVIGTSNLAERVVGYFTKWGDGASDLNPMGMLTKQEVYVLARYLGVPESIIDKKPSAGLWEGQTDEQDLGMTYPQIDGFILNGTSGDQSTDNMIRRRIEMSAHKFATIPIYS